MGKSVDNKMFQLAQALFFFIDVWYLACCCTLTAFTMPFTVGFGEWFGES